MNKKVEIKIINSQKDVTEMSKKEFAKLLDSTPTENMYIPVEDKKSGRTL